MTEETKTRGDLILLYILRAYVVFIILTIFIGWCDLTKFGTRNEGTGEEYYYFNHNELL